MARILGTWDYVVFVLMLFISATIGIYYRFTGGKQQTTKEYLLADKNMSALPVAFSLMASFMSAVTLLGVSSENYIHGTQFIIINLSYVFGTIGCIYLFLPVFFKLQTTSAYQYLELRFGRETRLIASAAFIIQMVIYMSIVLYAPALALNAVTGFPKWILIVAVGLVCTFYSTVGGMKAVLWTDVFQSLLMFAAILTVVFHGIAESGFSNIWRIADEGKRIQFFNFDPDPTIRHTFWTQTIGGMFIYASLYAVNQAQVQRLLTVKTLKQSQFALVLNWPILTCLSLFTSFSGLVIYSKYHNCDPIKSKRISLPDQLLPLYVMDFLSVYPGLAGLFVSGIVSGALSTVSSAVNSLSAVTLEDYIKPFMSANQFSDSKHALYSKIIALIYGLICVALAFVAEYLGGILQASLTIFSVIGGPIFGLFSLGMFIPFSNQKGAIVGLLVSLAFCLWIGFGANAVNIYIPKPPQSIKGCAITNGLAVPNGTMQFNNTSTISETTTTTTLGPPPSNEHILYIYRLSYMWLSPIGFCTTIIIGLITSSLFGPRPDVNADFLSPIIAKFYKKSDNEEVLQLFAN